MKDIFKASVLQLAGAIRQKQISARELLEFFLKRIKTINQKINAVVQLNEEEVLAEAQKCDQLLAKGLILGPFHGIPFTVKDIYNSNGWITTFGTLGRRNTVSTHDASLIAKIKNSGAILLGKTNIPEFCMAAETDNLIYGTTKNPYDLNRSAGGSSGGEGAIIAAGGSAFGVGSDLAGSIRIPAHFCGVVGLRPTVGRWACSHNFLGLKPDIGVRVGLEGALASDGPIVRHVDDLYPLLKAFSGPDGVDFNSVDIPVHDPQQISIADLKIAYFTDNEVLTPSEEIQSAVLEAKRVLEKQGAQLSVIKPLFMKEAMEILVQLMITSLIPENVEQILAVSGTQTPSAPMQKFYEQVKKLRQPHYNLPLAWINWDYYRTQVIESMHNYDALICPVMPFTAPDLQVSLFDEKLFPSLSYCVAFTLAKYPAVVVRVGEDRLSLPIGLQIVVKPWREDIAIAVAKHLENELGGWQMPRL